MIKDTDRAVKSALADIVDIDGRVTRLTWIAPDERVTTNTSPNTPVEDLTQTQIVVSRVGEVEDSNRARTNAIIEKQILKNLKAIQRSIKFWQPKQLMYEVSVRCEGKRALDRVTYVKGVVNNRLRSRSYLNVTTDLFGDDEKLTVPSLVILQNTSIQYPEETGRREFNTILTYMVDSALIDRATLRDVVLAIRATVGVTTNPSNGSPQEETIIE